MQHTEAAFEDDYFAGGGAGYPDYLKEGRILQKRGRWFARRLKRYLADPHPSIFDVGAAAGFVLKGFEEEGFQTAGIEPNATMARFAEQEFGYDIAVGGIEDYDGEEEYDVVSLIQVIAHVRDFNAAMDRVVELIAPGGFFLVETWDWQSLTARAFGRNWHEYSPPWAINWFSKHSLDQIFRTREFQKIDGGRPPKSIDLEHALSLAAYKFGKPAVTRFAEALGQTQAGRIPILYPFDDVFWALYRKN